VTRRSSAPSLLALLLAGLCILPSPVSARKAGKKGHHAPAAAAETPADAAAPPAAPTPDAAATPPAPAADAAPTATKPADTAPAAAAQKPASAGGSAAPAAAAVAAVKEKKARRIRVTVLPLLERNFPEQSAVALQRELAEGLRRNSHLDMKDLDVRLAEFAQEMPFEQVELARTALQNGTDALRNLNLDTAITQLNDAVDQLVAVLPYIKKQELADAMMTLAVAQQQKGATRAMQATLRRLLTWRSAYQLDTSQFPQQISDPLEEARTAVGQLAQGQVKVLSEPSGSQVFVDGDFVGVAPTTVSNLTVGEHYVTFKKLGYKRGLRIANVTNGPPLQVLGKLPRAEKYLLVQQAIDRVGPKIGQSKLDPVVDNLRETLFLDHAVFLRLQKAGTMSSNTEDVAVSAYLYDLRTRALIKQASEKVKMSGGVPPDGVMAKLAETLYQGVSYDNDLQAPTDGPPVALPQKPLYKRWWFWTTLGIIIAGGASAVAVGVLSRPPSCPDGHVCTGALMYSLHLGF
jgi:hypothetical protein